MAHYSTSTLHRESRAKRCSNVSHCGYCSSWTHTHSLTHSHTQFEERWRSALHDDALSSSKDPLITWYCNSSTVPNSTSKARFRFECLLCRISFIWFTGYQTAGKSMRNWAADDQTVLRLVLSQTVRLSFSSYQISFRSPGADYITAAN